MEKFYFRECSDVKYNEIVIDICWNSQTVATLNQDKGPEQIEIEIHPSLDGDWKFDFNEFVAALKQAKQYLEEFP